MKTLKFFIVSTVLLIANTSHSADLERLQYNHPGLIVDLGVGLWAWPLPMDFNGDGKLDLVVNCPDKPYNGLYLFETTAPDGGLPKGKGALPIFGRGKRISLGLQYVQVSDPDGKPRVFTPGIEYPDFLKSGLENGRRLSLPTNIHPNRVRGNFWRQLDFDADGRLDFIVGADDWTDYGWDNGYDTKGHWTRGPLRGFVYWVRNIGTNLMPTYDPPRMLSINDHSTQKSLEVFGWPSPNFADFDNDGDLDLICGEFLDGFTYFQNIGNQKEPLYQPGQRLCTLDDQPLVMDLEMITPTAIDWDRDGDTDLIVGDEDGRVAFVENLGTLRDDRTPQFQKPRYFQQQADSVKFGALATPFGFDWDGDGDIDILSGNTAGYIGFIENLSAAGVEKPKWARPQKLEAGGQSIRIMAGPNGSIQGPCEAKWGYTTLSVADWNHDGLPDLIVNSILGKVVVYENIGTRRLPILSAPQPIEVEWIGDPPTLAWGWLKPEGKALLTQWRTTPMALDWNADGLVDLVMLDHQGFLAFFERAKRGDSLILLPPQRVFQDEAGNPLQLSLGTAGKSGRRKFAIVDWDGDGKLDLLLNAANARFLKQIKAEAGVWTFQDAGLLSPTNIEGHDVSPAIVDFNGDRIPDFLGGAEDGHFYYLKNPRSH